MVYGICQAKTSAWKKALGLGLGLRLGLGLGLEDARLEE